jgi:L-iditol 2-dehydrogenase
MKAIQFTLSIPKYLATRAGSSRFKSMSTSPLSCVSLKEVPVPTAINDDWVRIRTIKAGICGSDLSVINGKTSFSLQPYSSSSFIFGHEIVGEVVERAPSVRNVNEGDRVVIEPSLSCVARGIKNKCANCKRGQTHLCLNLTNGHLSPATSIGFSNETGGGWGEYFIAHRTQLYRIPERFSMEEAVLVEPFSVALHAVLRRYPPNGAKVLVMGAGTIGLLTIAALKMLPIRCKIYATARYDFQKELAYEMGAHVVINPKKEDLYEKIAEESNGELFSPDIGKRVLEGGVQRVYDSIASPDTIDDALRLTQAGGSVVLVGSADRAKGVDLTPVWFREVDLLGSYIYSMENFRGRKIKTFDYAIELMKRNRKIPLSKLVTHQFPLDKWREAIRVAQSRVENKAVKVAFTFE